MKRQPLKPRPNEQVDSAGSMSNSSSSRVCRSFSFKLVTDRRMATKQHPQQPSAPPEQPSHQQHRRSRRRSFSVGRENHDQPPGPTEEWKARRRSSSRMRVVLGGVVGRMRRSSSVRRSVLVDRSTSRMTPSPTNLPTRTCNIITPCNAGSTTSTTIETALFAPVHNDETNDGSYRTADDTEPSTPFESDDEVVITLHGSLLPSERPVMVVVPNDEAEDPKLAAAAATLLQAHIRAYLQRYHYKFLVLQHKLRAIEATKTKQLQKLKERSKIAKKREGSVIEFQQDKLSRRLQRTTRVIPYLFREAQSKLQANLALANANANAIMLHDLSTSHLQLKLIAHAYLETLESIPGIWDALQAQWMTPKQHKPRVRRGFDRNGKIIRLSQKKKDEYNAHDDDLPVAGQASETSSAAQATAPPTPAEVMYLHTYFELDESQDMEGAFRHVQQVTEATMLN